MKQGEERNRNKELSQDQCLPQRETGGTSAEWRTGACNCKCHREHDFDYMYDFTGRTAGRSRPTNPLDHAVIEDANYTYSTRGANPPGADDSRTLNLSVRFSKKEKG